MCYYVVYRVILLEEILVFLFAVCFLCLFHVNVSTCCFWEDSLVQMIYVLLQVPSQMLSKNNPENR